MRVGIFTSGRKDWNVQELRKEAQKRGIECHEFPLNELVVKLAEKPKVSCRGMDLEEFDILLVRWVPKGSAEQLVFRMDVLHRLENLGVKVVNPASVIERCADKFYTNSLLEDAGIPVPPTVVTEKRGEAKKAFERYGEVVVKPLFGSLGAGMLKINDRDLAYRTFSIFEFGRFVYYVQKFIPHGGWDIRVLVVGEKIMAMKRIAEGWKTNVSIGGKAEPYEPEREIEKLALKSAKILGCEYAGVDIIRDEGGKPYVVEVNAIPGWKGLQTVRKERIAAVILDHILKSKRVESRGRSAQNPAREES